MIFWLTEIIAENPKTREVCKWAGPRVPGIDKQDAQNFCDKNGLGYCRVIGKFIEEEKQDESEFFRIETSN